MSDFLPSNFDFIILSQEQLILLCSLLLLIILSLRYENWLYAFCKKKMQDSIGLIPDNIEPISVILVCHDQAIELEKHLPQILQQDYPCFEVFVVMDNCTDHTEDMLKQLERKYTFLHHTFIPESARYVSHKKLGITLGVKAARYDLIVVSQPDCYPVSDKWLRGLSSHFTPQTDIVLGYANYEYNHTQRAKYLIYLRMMLELKWAFAVTRTKKAIGGDGCNLAFRKALFIRKKGYAGQLNLLCGADDLLIEKLAEKKRTRICFDKASQIRQTVPTDATFRDKDRLFRWAAYQHLRKKSKFRVLPWNVLHLLRLACWGLMIFLIAYSSISQQWFCLTLTSLFLIIYITGEILIIRKTAKSLDEPIRVPFLYQLMQFCSQPKWGLKRFIHRHEFYRNSETRY